MCVFMNNPAEYTHINTQFKSLNDHNSVRKSILDTGEEKLRTLTVFWPGNIVKAI